MANNTRGFTRELLSTALTAGLNWFKFTAGASGAVGTLYQGASNSVASVTRNSVGLYTVQFNKPFPGAVADVRAVVHPASIGNPAVDLNYVPGSFNQTAGTLQLRSNLELTDGVVATGTITNVAKANYDDTGDTVTISDGFTAVVYEFDFDGDGASGSNVAVNISAATTAESVALLLKTAIEANQPLFTVTTDGSGVVTLTQKMVGTAGNVTITEAVTDAGFLVTGMASGVNPTGALVELPENAEVHVQVVELRNPDFDR
jgi:hypothetical protein